MNQERDDMRNRNAGDAAARHISMELKADGARVTSLALDGGRLVLTIEAELESSHLHAGEGAPPVRHVEPFQPLPGYPASSTTVVRSDYGPAPTVADTDDSPSAPEADPHDGDAAGGGSGMPQDDGEAPLPPDDTPVATETRDMEPFAGANGIGMPGNDGSRRDTVTRVTDMPQYAEFGKEPITALDEGEDVLGSTLAEPGPADAHAATPPPLPVGFFAMTEPPPLPPCPEPARAASEPPPSDPNPPTPPPAAAAAPVPACGCGHETGIASGGAGMPNSAPAESGAGPSAIPAEEAAPAAHDGIPPSPPPEGSMGISEEGSTIGGDRHGEPMPAISFGVDGEKEDGSAPPPVPQAAPAVPPALPPEANPPAPDAGAAGGKAADKAPAPVLGPGSTTVLIRYTCPKCKTQGMQAVDKVGTVVNCSNCGKAMRLVMKK